MTFDEIEKYLKQASDSVAAMKRDLTTFFTALPDPFFILDTQGNYVEVLGGNAKHLYDDGTYLKGRNVSDVFTDELRDLFIASINEVVENRELLICEYEIKPELLRTKCELSSHWYEGRVVPVEGDNGEVAAVIWLAINITDKKRLEQRLKDLAEKDPMTGAYNRRFFREVIDQHNATFKRYGMTYSLAFIDIDYFKKVNDQFGHDVGDGVICHLVTHIQEQLRTIDLLARFGGEEFVVLFPHINLAEACLVTERLRATIEMTPYKSKNHKVPFTVSIGISEVRAEDENVEDILKRADNALYQSKSSGRNKVTRA